MNYFQPIAYDGFPHETFGRVFRIFGKRWMAFLWISLLVYVIGWACAVFTSLVLGGTALVDGYSVRIRLRYAENNPWHIASFVVESIIYYCFSCIANASITWLVAHLYLEQSPKVIHAFLHSARRLGSLISTLFVATLITLGPGFALLLLQTYVVKNDIFFQIIQVLTWFYIMYAKILLYHIYPVVVIEREKGHCINPWTILDRSFVLARKRFCYIFSVVFFWFLAKLLTTLPISLLRQMNTNDNGSMKKDTVFFYVACSLDTILGILYMTLDSVFQGVLYLQNRITKEKLDMVTLAEQLGVDSVDEEDNDYVVMKYPNEEESMVDDDTSVM
mmetsp:Transcript_2191/g.3256  ORF Transcript_2191/g.3256 Transcript_2191/m.3256 type:complete len:332 (-) Transcript_2191:58-1053(-)